MAKMTLLEMVQDILSDINSDEVNSISDTIEAEQIAQVIKSTYFDLIADTDVPEHFKLDQLTGLGDTSKPNYMQVPSTVTEVKWVKYDSRTTADPSISYVELQYVTPETFLERVLTNDSTSATIDTITDDSGVKLLIRNDKFPEFYTSFDDNIIVFDSYNSSEESSLTSSRSLIYTISEPAWTTSNDFIPNLDSNLFPLLLAEAKSLVFINNTQSSNPKVEQIARRHQSRKNGRKHKLTEAQRNDWPNFGRRR